MNAFVQAIVDDLRAFCSELLAAGLAPSAPAATAPGIGMPATFATTLRLLETMVLLVPQLLFDLDTGESADRDEIILVPTPRRAALPRRPADYQFTRGTLIPRRWELAVPVQEPDPRPLGFLLFVLDRLREDFGVATIRLRRHLDDARVARQGTSEHARHDWEQMARLDQSLASAESQLDRTDACVRRLAAGRVDASDRLPRPYPRSPSWTSLRRLADAILRPQQLLPEMLQSLLGNTTAVADLPFLYQRWVGTRIVLALAAMGFAAIDDPTGPLFVGGAVRFRRDDTQLTLWSEPRLSRLDHPSGLRAIGTEATPDFIFVVPGQGGDDAFVLDATLAHDPTQLARKATYRTRIVFAALRLQAGVPAQRRPLRAWAAAPLLHATMALTDLPDGSAGTLPMHPAAFAPGPLRAWLQDIADHAEAWSCLRQRRSAASSQVAG